MLANHIWSFAGEDDRPDISNTFMQPFVACTWPSAWTVSVQSESSYNCQTDQWSIPVNLGVSKLVKLGKLPVSLQCLVGRIVRHRAGGFSLPAADQHRAAEAAFD
jgi:hypothetical protein